MPSRLTDWTNHMESADEMAALQRHLLERTKDLHIENKSRQVFGSHTFVSMHPDIDGILDYPPDRNGTNDACNEPAELKPWKRELHTTAESFHITCAMQPLRY